MSYLTQGSISEDPYLRVRVAGCAAKEGCANAGINPDVWTNEWRRVWAAAPNWSQAWESALANEIEFPGKDESVITDGMILSQVQTMKPFKRVGQE